MQKVELLKVEDKSTTKLFAGSNRIDSVLSWLLPFDFTY
jgi:hypothetical protein